MASGVEAGRRCDMSAQWFEACLSGIFRLLHADYALSQSQVHRLRQYQQRLVKELGDIPHDPSSLAVAAIRADLLDGLNRLSLDIAGITFEQLCLPKTAAADAVLTCDLTAAEYIDWVRELGRAGDLPAESGRTVLRTQTLNVLQLADAIQRGEIIQLLYDAGLIFATSSILPLKGAPLARAMLVGRMLARADLAGVNLRGANCADADLSFALLRGAVLMAARMGWVTLTGVDMRDTEASGALLMGSDLRKANLAGANLVKATLRQTDLTEANLAGANLLGAHLEAAVLLATNLREANLLWADLSGARLEEVQLHRALYNRYTRWPVDFSPQGTGAIYLD